MRIPSRRPVRCLPLAHALLFLVPVPQDPPAKQCGGPQPGPDPGPTFELRWGGNIEDAFTLDGMQVWTAEGGGRIRYSPDGGLTWSFQRVPREVRGSIRRIHFLDDGLHGWAVSSDGWVLRTANGGDGWSALTRIETVDGEWADLYDVDFIDAKTGWVLGLFQVLMTTDGGSCWKRASLQVDGVALTPSEMKQKHVELYALDVYRSGHKYVGLAVSEPGWIFRTNKKNKGMTWDRVYDAEEQCGVSPCGLDLSYPGEAAADPCFAEKDEELELWDVEIARSREFGNEDFAVVVGGIGVGRGVILTSTGSSGNLDNTTLGEKWTQELHECALGDPGPPCDVPGPSPAPLNRIRTLYGVAVLSEDNRALAVGYNGQYLVRDPSRVPAGNCSRAVWKDASRFSTPFVGPLAPPPLQEHPVTPMLGVDAPHVSGGTGTAFAVGHYGHVARSEGPERVAWDGLFDGGPYRSRDLVALDRDHLYQCGQFDRIAESCDGGRTWRNDVGYDILVPDGVGPQAGILYSIAFADDGVTGVAVGDPWPSGFPRILRKSVDEGWTVLSTSSIGLPGAPQGHRLRSVEWVPGGEHGTFWAVGQGGMILTSTDGGKSFEAFVPDVGPEDLADHDFHDIGFVDADTGFVVGHVSGHARAYFLHLANASLVDVSPLAPEAERMTAVAVRGVHAVAVGRSYDGEYGEGIWAFDREEQRFVPFGELRPGQIFPWWGVTPLPPPPARTDVCIRPAGDEFDGLYVLNDVTVLSNGDVWIGGECGRILQYVARDGRWVEHKSETGLHVSALSFPDDTVGYANAVISQTAVLRHEEVAGTPADPPPCK